MPPELTEEEIMLDDLDPMDAIRQIRRDEGVAEEDLPERDDGASDVPAPDEVITDDGEDELTELRGEGEPAAAAAEDNEPVVPAADADAEGDAAKDPAAAEPEADPKAEGEDPDADPVKPADDVKPEVKLRQFKANGQDFSFTEDEILQQFETVFGQAMDYTKKMQKIAPFRKMISAIEAEGVSEDQLNTAIDALKGDKGAIQKILKDNKIDSYDLTDDEAEAPEYVPSVYGKDESALAIEEITGKIQGDEEYKITVNVIDEQWDGSSRQQLLKNPTMITGLHNDIKTGLYDKVAPVAMKMKVLDGNSKSDIEYYMLAGEKLRTAAAAAEGETPPAKTAAEPNAEAQAGEDEFDEASSEAKRKRAAASTGARADRKGVIDYLDDDNDEAFDDWYKKLQSSI